MSYGLMQEQLHEVLRTLSEREAAVVKMRFGLVDGQPKTLDEIGREFGLTRERIRQIEAKTLVEAAPPQPRAEAARLPRLTAVQPVSPQEFEDLVADALDLLPPEIAAHFANVVVVVEDEHPDDPDLLGLYEGAAHRAGALQRGAAGPDQPLPDPAVPAGGGPR